MLAEFERDRTVDRQVADEMASELYKAASSVLEEQGKSKRRIGAALLSLSDPRSILDSRILLGFDDLLRIKELSRDVDLGESEPSTVTLMSFGGNSKSGPFRILLNVEELSHFLEIRSDHAFIWNTTRRGKRTISNRGGRADTQELNFYKYLLDSFTAS